MKPAALAPKDFQFRNSAQSWTSSSVRPKSPESSRRKLPRLLIVGFTSDLPWVCHSHSHKRWVHPLVNSHNYGKYPGKSPFSPCKSAINRVFVTETLASQALSEAADAKREDLPGGLDEASAFQIESWTFMESKAEHHGKILENHFEFHGKSMGNS